jgi:hypothetical protein
MLGLRLGRDLDRIAARVRRRRFERNLVGPFGRVLVHVVVRVVRFDSRCTLDLTAA